MARTTQIRIRSALWERIKEESEATGSPDPMFLLEKYVWDGLNGTPTTPTASKPTERKIKKIRKCYLFYFIDDMECRWIDDQDMYWKVIMDCLGFFPAHQHVQLGEKLLWSKRGEEPEITDDMKSTAESVWYTIEKHFRIMKGRLDGTHS